ncbi:hypothetical protein V6Z12_A01G113200 [Gossypium hirsutum]
MECSEFSLPPEYQMRVCLLGSHTYPNRRLVYYFQLAR